MSCADQGYKVCITQSGECTRILQDCKYPCIVTSECCIGELCKSEFKSQEQQYPLIGSSTNTTILIIVLIILLTMIILIIFMRFNISRRNQGLFNSGNTETTTPTRQNS